MPYCRSCGARITKFEKDMCPICGAKNPLEGASSDTIEVTSELDINEKTNRKIYKAHFRFDTFMWFSFLGFTGAGFFYLNFKKVGYIWLAANLAFIGGLIALFVALLSPKSWISYVAPIALTYVINMAIGVYYLVKKDVKDGNGEFIH